MPAAWRWVCAHPDHAHPKHAHGWVHAVFALTLGLLCSVVLGHQALARGWVGTAAAATANPAPDAEANDNVYAAELAALRPVGYFFAAYHAVMVACRAWIKGPEELYNQLWACNTGMALCTTGILTHRRALVGAACGVVAVDQILWYVDCTCKVVFGKFSVGVARYLEWPETPFVQKVFSWHHLWFLPVSLWYLRVSGGGGMPAEALPLTVLGVFSMTLVSRVVPPASLNINMCHAFWRDVKIAPLHLMDGKAFYIYVPWIMAVFCAVDLPLFPLLVWCAGGWSGGGGGDSSYSGRIEL